MICDEYVSWNSVDVELLKFDNWTELNLSNWKNEWINWMLLYYHQISNIKYLIVDSHSISDTGELSESQGINLLPSLQPTAYADAISWVMSHDWMKFFGLDTRKPPDQS